MGDVMPVLTAARWIEKRAPKVLGPRRLRHGGPFSAATRLIERREPLGHVAIIATWNYPIQLLGIELLHALAAGNRVTVKPSEHAPRSQEMLLSLFREAAVPGGDEGLRWVSATREAGAALLREGRFDHVVFTGSTGVGREIAQSLAPTLTPSTLELSGRDSALVLDDADAELAASAIWQSVEINGGQTCMAPRRALVHEKVYGAFVRHLAPRASASKPRRLVSEAAATLCHDLAVDAVRAGARSLSGIVEGPTSDATGRRRMLRPLALADCPTEASVVEGRHFGPVLAVVRCADEESMLRVHAGVDQRLVTSVFSASRTRAEALAPRLGSGIVTHNDCVMPTVHPGCGLAGVGASGWGITRGEEGLRSMTRAVYVTSTTSWMRFSMEKVTPGVERGMAWFLERWYGR